MGNFIHSWLVIAMIQMWEFQSLVEKYIFAIVSV